MADPAAEFQHLLNQQEIAAYSMTAVVNEIYLFWEALSQEEVYERLELARAEFQRAEAAIAQFRKSHNLGETRHGNRSAA